MNYLKRVFGLEAAGRYCNACRHFRPHPTIEDPHYGECTRSRNRIDQIDGSIKYRNVEFARMDCLGWRWESKPDKKDTPEDLGY